MKKKLFDSQLAIAVHSKTLFAGIAAISLISNIFLAIFVMNVDTREKTVVVPVGFDKPFYVKGTELDPSYAKQMAKMIAQNRWNYTPKTAGRQFKEILQFVEPKSYALLESQLDSEVIKVKRNRVSSSFLVDGIRINLNNNEITVRGENVTFMGSQIVSNKIRFLRLKMNYFDGRFNLVSMKEVRGKNFDELEEIDVKEKEIFKTDSVEVIAEKPVEAPIVEERL